MSSKPPKQVTQTSVSQPPDYITPYLRDIASQARNLYYSDGPDYYPGATTVGFSPQTQEALGLQEDRARFGNPAIAAAQNQNIATSRGDYLYGNPGFNAAVQAATDYALPQINSQFALSGRSGSGLAQEAQTRAIANAFASQYGQERENQQRATALAPLFAQADYQDISALRDVGSTIEGQAQNRLADQISRYNYYQNLPEQKLGTYLQFLSGNYGTQAANTAPVFRNQAAGAVGGAASGASIGSYFGPWGALIGALGGGILGGQ